MFSLITPTNLNPTDTAKTVGSDRSGDLGLGLDGRLLGRGFGSRLDRSDSARSTLPGHMDVRDYRILPPAGGTQENEFLGQMWPKVGENPGIRG